MRLKITVILLVLTAMLVAQDNKKKHKKNTTDDWSVSEYSGQRTAKDIRMAMSSKAFAWLSGSPADNEKLSVGKTAQFFGFVAIRYASGRAAKRGSLGRAFYEIASEQQRAVILKAVKDEEQTMKEWWDCRSRILRILENYLYTGEAVDKVQLGTLARKFGFLNSLAAYHEAKAFAAVEDMLTEDQKKKLSAWRKNPDLVNTDSKNRKFKKMKGMSRESAAQYEDLFAKCFSWLTGTMKHNQVIPLGQPAQFFGFVSIRHKSGHGASRGKISKEFSSILNKTQQNLINNSLITLTPKVAQFIDKRNELLHEMDKLRKTPGTFSMDRFKEISEKLGILEVDCGLIEAETYHNIRKSMTPEQSRKMMDLRSDYIIDQEQMEKLTISQRGKKLYKLCAACHNKAAKVAPELTDVFKRDAGSVIGYEYSTGMNKHAAEIKKWNEQNMNQFLEDPMKTVPGTKMGFQGLLNQDDRTAIIEYLKQLK